MERTDKNREYFVIKSSKHYTSGMIKYNKEIEKNEPMKIICSLTCGS